MAKLTGVRHTLYSTWASMINRCECKTSKAYERYGAKGVCVCARWRKSFAAFVEDVGERPGKEYSLDRFPNAAGNYEPGNVRWATRRQQARNRRNYRINASDDEEMVRVNLYLEDQQISDLKEESSKLGFSYSELIRRAIDEYIERKAREGVHGISHGQS